MNNNNMTANELRIGNIVDLGNRIAKIIDISHLSCTVADLEETQDTIEDYDRVQGLILTDEWFEKWGFYKDGEYWSMGIFDYKYCFKYRDWANNWAFYQEYTDSPDSNDDGKKYPISFDIQYVHQLQNIWYSLLHEEIEQ
jgi:hypothetical protein